MSKTYRNWDDSESDKRNSRKAKQHAKMKQKEGKQRRNDVKDFYKNLDKYDKD